MVDRKPGRGPHPADQDLFSAGAVAKLQDACDDLAWLLSRSYASPSALKLVGDRYQLTARQRTAVMRSTCSDAAASDRAARQVPISESHHCELEIDAFNVIVTLESALGGGVVLSCRDQTYRDMASMHGNYRCGKQTQQAIELLGKHFADHRASVLFRIDRPVSNSGRLAQALRQHADLHDLSWDVVLDDDPDPLLGLSGALVASADAAVLDRTIAWVNLARHIIDTQIPSAWIVPMSKQVGHGR